LNQERTGLEEATGTRSGRAANAVGQMGSLPSALASSRCETNAYLVIDQRIDTHRRRNRPEGSHWLRSHQPLLLASATHETRSVTLARPIRLRGVRWRPSVGAEQLCRDAQLRLDRRVPLPPSPSPRPATWGRGDGEGGREGRSSGQAKFLACSHWGMFS